MRLSNSMKKITKNLLNISIGLIASTTSVLYANNNETIEQSISLYGWLPSLDGNIAYSIPYLDNGTNSNKEGESNIADNLDMILMGSYEARKDQWSLLTDIIYLKMSASEETSIASPSALGLFSANIASEQELTGLLLGVYGGYNIIDDELKMDFIAGVRYFSLEFDISLVLNNVALTIAPSIDALDAIVGVQGSYTINEDWYIPYHLDIGTGDSDITMEADISLGYRFDWGDVLLTYRYLHYGFGDDRIVNDFDLYGPKIGLVFHF